MAEHFVAKVGEEVTVEMRNRSAVDRTMFPGNDTIVYHGKVIASEKFDPPGSFRITGDTLMPVRVISTSHMISCNGKTAKPSAAVLVPVDRLFAVKGSKGSEYVVTVKENGQGYCTCAGYGFRRTCKHVAGVMETLGKK